MRLIPASVFVLAAALAASSLCAQGLDSDEFDFQTQKARVIAELARAAASGNPKASQSAVNALLDLHQAIYQPLMEAAGSPDLEIRARVTETLRQVVLEATCARASLNMPPPIRRQFDQLVRQQRELVAMCLLGDESDRIFDVARLRKREDLRDQLAPLLIAVADTGSTDMAAAAAVAANQLNVQSEDLSQSLARAMVRALTYQESDPNRANFRQVTSPFNNYPNGAVGALVQFLTQNPTKKNSPILLGAVLGQWRGHGGIYYLPRNSLYEAITGSGDLGLLPPLIDRLADRTFNTTIGTGGKDTVSVTSGDQYLAMAIALSNQSPSTYDMVDVTPFGYNEIPYGFRKDSDRQAAHAKFRKWWKTAQESAPYKGVKPVEPVEVFKSPTPTPSPSNNTTMVLGDGTSRPAEAELPSTEPIVTRLTADVRRHVKDLGAPRQAVRERAQAAIAAVSAGLLSAIAGSNDDGPPPAAVVSLLGRSAAESRLQVFLSGLTPADRDKVLQFQKTGRSTLQEIFSNNAGMSTAAIRKLGAADPQGLSEPLLLYEMRQPSMLGLLAAVEAIGDGHHKSDAIGAALLEAMMRQDVRIFGRNYGMYNKSSPIGLLLTAIKATRPPEAAGTVLACLMQRSYRYDWTGDNQFVATLVELDDKRVMQTVIAELRDPNNQQSMNQQNVNGKTIGWSPKDSMLYLGVKLSGQAITDYSIQTHKWSEDSVMIGFADDKARKAAYKKFLDWWDNAKDAPPYKDLKPLKMPVIRQQDDYVQLPQLFAD